MAADAADANKAKNEDKVRLEEIKETISDRLSREQSDWRQVYKLLCEVKDNKLYEQDNVRSFTQWVKNLAEENKISESLIWRMNKAGETFQRYKKYLEKAGKDTSKIENTKFYPEQLDLIAKVAGNSDERREELFNEVAAGGLTTTTLRRMAVAARSEREAKRKAAMAAKAAKAKNAGNDSNGSNNENDSGSGNSSDSRTNATDVIGAISRCRRIVLDELLPEKDEDDEDGRGKKKRYEKEMYSEFPEFPVITGTSRHARRIDLMIAENVTCDPHEISLHGVEIKVDRNDLIKDKKCGEYADFCDYCYLAVPNELIADAETVILDGWGLISVRFENGRHIAKLVKVPSRLDAKLREFSLMTAVIKLGGRF